MKKLVVTALLTLTSAAAGQPLEPIPSTFDTVAARYTTDIPGDSGPDVGAFRFICMPVGVGTFDPIVFPGQANAGHEHLFFGNKRIQPGSTYETLRAAGIDDGSCQGMGLNLSGYWVPSLKDGAGHSLVPDYMGFYYKGDCNGCVPPVSERIKPVPTGLRLIGGYNMAKPSKTPTDFHPWKCLRKDKYVLADGGALGGIEHRDFQTLLDAGCGSVDGDQLFGVIHFGNCWNGQIDSADHRSHITYKTVRNPNTGALSCPTTHPTEIPLITQQVVWTLKPGDTGLHLSSDVMKHADGTTHVMRAGSTFHADYMEGWDAPTRETWHRKCIVEHRNAAAANFCDGTAGKHPEGFRFTAAERGGRYFTSTIDPVVGAQPPLRPMGETAPVPPVVVPAPPPAPGFRKTGG